MTNETTQKLNPITSELKTFLEDMRRELKEGLNEISRDFINDHQIDSFSYLSDGFREVADQYTSIYYSDQRDYFHEHPIECENALLDLYDSDSLADFIKKEGLDGLICRAGACGEYEANLNELCEDENKIKRVLACEWLLDRLDEITASTDEIESAFDELDCLDEADEMTNLLEGLCE